MPIWKYIIAYNFASYSFIIIYYILNYATFLRNDIPIIADAIFDKSDPNHKLLIGDKLVLDYRSTTENKEQLKDFEKGEKEYLTGAKTIIEILPSKLRKRTFKEV